VKDVRWRAHAHPGMRRSSWIHNHVGSRARTTIPSLEGHRTFACHPHTAHPIRINQLMIIQCLLFLYVVAYIVWTSSIIQCLLLSSCFFSYFTIFHESSPFGLSFFSFFFPLSIYNLLAEWELGIGNSYDGILHPKQSYYYHYYYYYHFTTIKSNINLHDWCVNKLVYYI